MKLAGHVARIETWEVFINIWLQNMEVENHFGYLDVGSAQRRNGCFKNNNKEGIEFIDELSFYQHLKKDCSVELVCISICWLNSDSAGLTLRPV